MEQLKPSCSIPQGHLVPSEGHSHCLWMVKQTDKDSTREKIKEMGRTGKPCFDSHLCSVAAVKLV